MGQEDSTRDMEPHFHRSSIGQGCFRPCKLVGEGGGVYVRLFAHFGSSVEPKFSTDQPEAVKIESWMWMRARTD